MMNPSQTIREIAALTPSPEMKSKFDLLAAQLEVQHSQQNGHWSVVFGQLENHVTDQLAAMRYDLTQEAGNTEAKLQAILDLFDKLRSEVRELQRAKARGDNAGE